MKKIPGEEQRKCKMCKEQRRKSKVKLGRKKSVTVLKTELEIHQGQKSHTFKRPKEAIRMIASWLAAKHKLQELIWQFSHQAQELVILIPKYNL